MTTTKSRTAPAVLIVIAAVLVAVGLLAALFMFGERERNQTAAPTTEVKQTVVTPTPTPTPTPEAYATTDELAAAFTAAGGQCASPLPLDDVLGTEPDPAATVTIAVCDDLATFLMVFDDPTEAADTAPNAGGSVIQAENWAVALTDTAGEDIAEVADALAAHYLAGLPATDIPTPTPTEEAQP